MKFGDFTALCSHLDQIFDNALFNGGDGVVQRNEYARIRTGFYKKLKNESRYLSFLPTAELPPELKSVYKELLAFCAELKI